MIGVPAQLIPFMNSRYDEADADDLIFVNARGGRIKHSTFYPQVWERAVLLANGREPEKDWQPSTQSMWHGIMPAKTRTDRLGKRPRIHDMRHTAASWAIAAGASLQDVQYFLGHESLTTTADRYGHLMPGRMEAVAQVMSIALSPAIPDVMEIEA